MITLMVIATALAPGRDWAWLGAAVRRLQADAHPVRSIIDRLRPVDDLLKGALKAMAEAETRPPRLRTDQSSWYRDALMLAVLACRAPRHKNLAEMRLGWNLIYGDDHYLLRFTAEEIKTGKPYEAPLPDALTPWIDRYLTHHRVVLLQGRETDALWISNQGRPMHYGSIPKQLGRLTKQLFGIAINVHAFRHAIATSTAIQNPKHILDIGPVLHNRPETGGRYYNKANGIMASRSHSATIVELRSKLQRSY